MTDALLPRGARPGQVSIRYQVREGVGLYETSGWTERRVRQGVGLEESQVRNKMSIREDVGSENLYMTEIRGC